MRKCEIIKICSLTGVHRPCVPASVNRVNIWLTKLIMLNPDNLFCEEVKMPCVFTLAPSESRYKYAKSWRSRAKRPTFRIKCSFILKDD